MKRRGFLKLLGLAAAAPALIAKALEPKSADPIDWSDNPIARSAGHVKELSPLSGEIGRVKTLAFSANPFLFAAGDTITIGDDPTLLTVTKTYNHGIDVIRGGVN